MKVLILAGGSGTRLWPLSRQNYPKQFIKINGESLLLKTYKRFLNICDKKDIYIVTNEKYKFYVINDLIDINSSIENNIILEPVGRNTSGAILLGIKFITNRSKSFMMESLFVSPSDHIITNTKEFIKCIKEADKASKKGSIVTFGIKPDTPHTGYGYIKTGKKLFNNLCKVEEFTEKPDIKRAREYLSSEKYLWNSGMFLFKMDIMIKEFKKYKPEMIKFFNLSYDELIKRFGEIENISIDYSIMEKTDKAAVVKSDIGWSDIGNWESFGEIMEKDESSNVKLGNVFNINSSNSIVYSNSKKVVSIVDVKDLIIINTDDALLVAKKGSGEKVKNIVELLKNQKCNEALEHTTVFRPWGSYTVLEEGPRYKIKRIFVKPNHKLSEQMHYHRSEHWIVIKGTAEVDIGGESHIVHENESIYVAKSMKHRLSNPGKVDLELIEVQNGEYVGEDDIVRFDDVYGRK
jgi:mannose-1-phosphate guanylyltransferase/mannose-6-phosphate isomerase